MTEQDKPIDEPGEVKTEGDDSPAVEQTADQAATESAEAGEVDITGGDDAGEASDDPPGGDTATSGQAAETADPAEDAGNGADVDISGESDAVTDAVTDDQDPADPPAPIENEDPPGDEPDDPKPIAASAPAPDGIEAAAATAAEADPHKPDLPPEKPKATPAAKVAMPKQKRAKATQRKKQTDGSKGNAAKPSANQEYLAAKRARRPATLPEQLEAAKQSVDQLIANKAANLDAWTDSDEDTLTMAGERVKEIGEAIEATKPTQAQLEARDKKAAVAEELAEIKVELEEMDAFRVKLVARQQELVSPRPKDSKPRPFHVIHQEVLARSREIRVQRVRDRLKLLAKGAGMSPLDRALHDRPRANADPKPNTAPTP